jgi:glycosyltransferase involved in cell wall biosynthesis
MEKSKRMLWLMNRTRLREFEMPILSSLGYEIFLPKVLPHDEGNLDATIEADYDTSLTLPSHELEILNLHDFYSGLTPQVAEIINKHFSIVISDFYPDQLAGLVRKFFGVIVMRCFGLPDGETYTNTISKQLGPFFLHEIEIISERFWFGQAYDHLADIECSLFRNKAVTLPFGLDNISVISNWDGSDGRLLFFCPRIGSSTHYRNIYNQFKKEFGDLPYIIGGAQPIDVVDPNVKGFVSRDHYDAMLRNAPVVYYHGRDKHRLSYYPLDAIRAGAPLVFMGGGLLDKLAGETLPGSCRSIREAKRKIRRLLNRDKALAETIRQSQSGFLASLEPTTCQHKWYKNFGIVAQALRQTQETSVALSSSKPKVARVAVILSHPYRGGTLDMVKLLAKLIKRGAEIHGTPLHVVFAHIKSNIYSDDDFRDLVENKIERRELQWKFVNRTEFEAIQKLSGYVISSPRPRYCVPDDGINNLLDCDLWLLGVDRFDEPIAPLRPYCIFVHDYIQRYVPELFKQHIERGFFETTRDAIAVLANTPMTIEDVVQYVGVPRRKTMLVPHLVELEKDDVKPPRKKGTYFIWTSNAALHKNHFNTLQGLARYYQTSKNALDCHVTGYDTHLFDVNNKDGDGSPFEHIQKARDFLKKNPRIAKRIKFHGELPSNEYLRILSEARFLLHSVVMDNGTLCAVEAAFYGTPVLSSDYPQMRYLSDRYQLQAVFFDPADHRMLAGRLHWMEQNWAAQRTLLPDRDFLLNFSWRNLASEFWGKLGEFLQ